MKKNMTAKITFKYSPEEIKNLILEDIYKNGYAMDGEMKIFITDKPNGGDWPISELQYIEIDAVKVSV